MAVFDQDLIKHQVFNETNFQYVDDLSGRETTLQWNFLNINLM